MTEKATDPVERLAYVVRQVDARMPDTQRARGAQALVERMRRDGGAAQVAPSGAGWRRGILWSAAGLTVAAALLVAFLPRRERPLARAEAPAAPKVPEQAAPPAETPASQTALAILRPMNESGGEIGHVRLEAGPGQEIWAWLADCGRVVLRAGAALAVEENAASGISLHLERGTVLVAFDHDSGRGLTVRTRDALVRVAGTVFAVAAGEGPTRVSVSHGSVEVAAGALPVSVSAGKSWQVGAASLGVPDPGTALALRELRALDAPRAAVAAGRPSRPAGTSAEPAPGAFLPAAPGEQPERAAESIYRAAESALVAGRSDAAKDLLETLVTNHPRDPLAAPASYELARLSFAAKDYARAREQLRSVRDSTKPAVAAFREPAAFLLCRAELESGQQQAALSCLERFRADFPDSPHGGDALALLATSRLGEKDCVRGKALVEEYLRRFPRGSHAPRLREGMRECR